MNMLHEEPSELLFRAIFAALDKQELVEEQIPELQRLLDGWEPRCRSLRCSKEELTAATQSHIWPLIAALVLDCRPSEAQERLASVDCKGIRTLVLNGTDSDSNLLRFSPAAYCPNLTGIEFVIDPSVSKSTLGAFLFDGLPSSLTSIAISGFLEIDLWDMFSSYLESENAQQLREISVCGCPHNFFSNLVRHYPPQLQTLRCEVAEVDPSDLALFSDSEGLPSQLRELSLNACNLGDGGASVLLSCPHFQRLERLSLASNHLTWEGLKPLRSSKAALRLKQLNCSGNPIENKGVELLASPSCDLKELSLMNTQVSDEALLAMSHSKAFQHLAKLHLSSNHITDGGVTNLLNSDFISSLHVLKIDFNLLTDKGIQGLFSSEALSNLKELDVSGSGWSEQVDEELVKSRSFLRLKKLSLANCPLTVAGHLALHTFLMARQLRELNLAYTRLNDEKLQQLFGQSEKLGLWSLNLLQLGRDGEVGDDGIYTLADSRSLQELLELSLLTPRGSRKAVKALATSSALPSLDKLYIDGLFYPIWRKVRTQRPVFRAFLEHQKHSN